MSGVKVRPTVKQPKINNKEGKNKQVKNPNQKENPFKRFM